MPVYCLEGTGGSGKSLYVIDKYIVPWLKRGKPVFTNIEGLKPLQLAWASGLPEGQVLSLLYQFPCDETYDKHGQLVETNDKNSVRNFYRWEFDGKTITDFFGALIVIDEAQNYFGSRDFKEGFSRDVIDYLSRNRHYKHTVLWLTQNIDSVDITFRRQTAFVYFLEKNETGFTRGSSKMRVWEGWQKSEFIKPLKTETYQHNKKYYGCYQSYVKGSEDEEEHRDTHNMWLSYKPLWVVLGLFALVLVVALINGNPLNALTKPLQKTKTTTATPTHPPKGLGVAESVAGESATEEPCVLRTFKLHGKNFARLNNYTTIEYIGDMPYEVCAESSH